MTANTTAKLIAIFLLGGAIGYVWHVRYLCPPCAHPEVAAQPSARQAWQLSWHKLSALLKEQASSTQDTSPIPVEQLRSSIHAYTASFMKQVGAARGHSEAAMHALHEALDAWIMQLAAISSERDDQKYVCQLTAARKHFIQAVMLVASHNFTERKLDTICAAYEDCLRNIALYHGEAHHAALVSEVEHLHTLAAEMSTILFDTLAIPHEDACSAQATSTAP